MEQRKKSYLKLVVKNIKKLICQKKKQMLENRRKKYKEMDASKKKQMLNRKALKSRKRKISKLNVDVCIMESRIPLGPGKFHVVVLVYLRISCSSCLAANSFRNRLGFSQNEVSGSVFFCQSLGLGFC